MEAHYVPSRLALILEWYFGFLSPMKTDSSVAIGVRDPALPLSENKHLLKWVEKMAELTKPASLPGIAFADALLVAFSAALLHGGAVEPDIPSHLLRPRSPPLLRIMSKTERRGRSGRSSRSRPAAVL